jgi:hypothetical protein
VVEIESLGGDALADAWYTYRWDEHRTYRVGRRVEKVRTSVSTNGVVSCTVNAKISAGEVALHASLEGSNVLAGLNEVRDDFISGIMSSMLVQIAAQTPRIVSQPIFLWVWLDALGLGLDRPNRNGPVCKRARNTTASTPSWKFDGAGEFLGDASVIPSRHIGSAVRYTSIAAVEER